MSCKASIIWLIACRFASRGSMDVRLEAFETEEAMDLPEPVDSIDVMLSVSENGEVVAGGTLMARADSVDLTLSVSENGYAAAGGQLVALVDSFDVILSVSENGEVTESK